MSNQTISPAKLNEFEVVLDVKLGMYASFENLVNYTQSFFNYKYKKCAENFLTKNYIAK